MRLIALPLSTALLLQSSKHLRVEQMSRKVDGYNSMLIGEQVCTYQVSVALLISVSNCCT